MKTAAFIIARLSSSRLPEKNLMPILGKPMIEHLIHRVRKSKLIDEVCIVTSNLESDDKLEEFAKVNNIPCYRGSLDNIMERIIGAANYFGSESIVEILGDNPLVHSELIDDVVDLFNKTDSDYAANLTKEYPQFNKKQIGFPVGIRVQIYKKEVAEKYLSFPEYINSDKHPTSFIFENTDKYKVSFVEPIDKWGYLNHPDLHFAVNLEKNFRLINIIFEELYKHDSNFDFKDIIEMVNKNKDLLTLMG